MDNEKKTFKEGLKNFPSKNEEKSQTKADDSELTKNGTQRNDSNKIERKVGVLFDEELFPEAASNEVRCYYVDHERFKVPKTIDPDLEPDSQFDL